ncbi:MAG: phosphoenolpyruvate carboxykinase (ATP) [Chlorobiota bacterium]
MKSPDSLRQWLLRQGFHNVGEVYYNLTPAELYEYALRRGEGVLSAQGAFIARTAPYTGRSAQDKFIVEEPANREHIWWGKVNRPFPPEGFERLKRRLQAYFQGRPLYVRDCYGGADPRYRLRVRIVTEQAWHSLFAANMFIPADPDDTSFEPDFAIVHAPGFKTVPELDGTRSEVIILLNFAERMALIAGTAYAGEIKKTVFTVLNYLLPFQGVFPMHCAANVGKEGDVALFFGLSGTGKTSLSADPERALIGDDEHGWSDDGVFNFENGCYAKVINLSPEAEPIIYAMTRRFGTILENVVYDPETREVDYADASITENTRGSYSRDMMENVVPENRGGHPRNIFFLTCDAFGVMPPIARLSPEQAMYHFLSGFTAKVAGTERGIKDPVPTFSTCFGAPFMVHYPWVYARMLAERMQRHGSRVWLVNTGWIGGGFGVGHRISIAHTRALLRAALSGALEGVEYVREPFFGLEVPTSCPGVPQEILQPRQLWADPNAYDEAARRLQRLFAENFQQFRGAVDGELLHALPLELVEMV